LSAATEENHTRYEWQKQLVLAVATALLLAATNVPSAGWALAPLAFVALVPLALLVGHGSWRRTLGLAYLGGTVFFCAGIGWLARATVVGWLALCAYLALYVALAAAGTRVLWCRAGLPMGLSLPIAWTSAEFLRARLFPGFPYLLLGHSQSEWIALAQLADVTGVYGISFLVAAVNGLVCDAVLAIEEGPGQAGRSRGVAWAALCVVALLAGAWGYGFFRLHTTRLHPGPKVAVVQANIPQALKQSTAAEDRRRIFEAHVALSELALLRNGESPDNDPVEMIVWPETMIPGVLNARDDPWSAEMRRRLTELARKARCPLLVGGFVFEGTADGPRIYNSAILIDPAGGAEQPAARYDKLHLVPFGEYVPAKRLLWLLLPMVPFNTGISPGREALVLDLGHSRFGVSICFEDAFPELVRRSVASHQRSDFLVNISNDGWFGDSVELDQHLAMARFRAVETRIGVVRASNTGISAFIAPTGRIQRVLEEDGRRRMVSGILIARVQLDDRRTFYGRHGDLFAWANLVSCILLAAGGWVRAYAGGRGRTMVADRARWAVRGPRR
jgi:apolipoprotein N-acyltransferase